MYYRGGAILPQTSEPGYHFHTPFVTRVEPVQINIQTDLVRNIPCGTQGGTVIHFEKIEVVNRLRRENVLQTVKDYGVNYVRPRAAPPPSPTSALQALRAACADCDRDPRTRPGFTTRSTTKSTSSVRRTTSPRCTLPSSIRLTRSCQQTPLRSEPRDLSETPVVRDRIRALQEDCDKWQTGIEILSIRVTKPRIPHAIQENYAPATHFFVSPVRTFAFVANWPCRAVRRRRWSPRRPD